MAQQYIFTIYSNALAEVQRDRNIQKRWLLLWRDRRREIEDLRKVGEEARASARRRIQQANWGGRDDEDDDIESATIGTPSRASSVTMEYTYNKRPIDDDEYLRELEKVRPPRLDTLEKL